MCGCLGGARERVLLEARDARERVLEGALWRVCEERERALRRCGPSHGVVACRRDEGPGPERREPSARRARAGKSSVPHAGGTLEGRSPSGRREKGKSRLLFLFSFMGFVSMTVGRRLWVIK